MEWYYQLYLIDITKAVKEDLATETTDKLLKRLTRFFIDNGATCEILANSYIRHQERILLYTKSGELKKKLLKVKNAYSKNIIVTGALGHLGTATCKILSEHGANVYGLDLSRQDEPFKVLKADLCSVESIEKTCRNIHPDALVNIAGGFALDESPFGPCEKNWEKMFRLNVTTLTNISKVIIPKLINQKKEYH